MRLGQLVEELAVDDLTRRATRSMLETLGVPAENVYLDDFGQ